jgi:phage portal protein BeeE
MKLFGLNISRSSSAPVTKSGSESDAAAWLRGEDITTNTTVLSNAYQQVVWVYRAINVLAEQVANIPFLFSAGERGRENLITSGPLLDFYDRPHPHMNRFQYWELRVIWLMLRGECFRIPIYEDSGSSSSSFSSSSSAPSYSHAPRSPRSTLHAPRRLKNVLLLDPSHFHHIIENHQLVGWRYTGFGRNTPLESQVFLPEEVWFEKLPNPFDFWRGMPPLYVAEVAAKTDYAAGAFMKGLIENNADLGVVVRTQTPLDPTQREQILAALRNRKNKAGTADRPLLLWSGAEIIKPQLSSADMQFLDHRKFSRAEICAAFGIPEEIITTTDKAKYDVMQGARLNFIENRVAPLCARLEAEEEATVRSIDRNAVGWFDTDALPIMQEAGRSRFAAV